ncbi:MAG TPA: ribose-phosphate pyrophosphokinase [Longimicrobiales bacterium]
MNTILLAGAGNPRLAEAIAAELHLGLTPVRSARFPDGELSMRIEGSVQDCHVVVLQPTSRPVDNNVIELLALGDAARRAGCARLSAVVPYFGYARSDVRKAEGEPIMAKLMAQLIEAVGYQDIITVDLHASAIEAFFQIPVHNLSSIPVFCEALKPRLHDDTVVVSPDLGRAAMARAMADALQLSVAIVHKRRTGSRSVEALSIVGEVAGQHCLIVDDMISTGCTVIEAMHALARAGAIMPPTVAATHAVLVAETLGNLHEVGIEKLYLTDTIHPPLSRTIQLEVVSIAPLLANAVRALSGAREEQHVANAF